jgi:hypothetical protein
MHRTNTIACREFLSQSLVRRDFLRVGALGTLGLSLPDLFAAEARASNYGGTRASARARSCILLFLGGGPSHYETFDPNPDAPSEVRNIFQTIPTNVPGTFLSEFLPDLARQADRYALVRSMWHKYGGHFGGHRYALTGHAAPGNPDQPARADDQPGIIAHARKHLVSRNSFPATVMTPWPSTDQGSGASGGMGGGVLGRQFDPVMVEVDQSTLDKPGKAPVLRVPEFALRGDVSPDRFENRRALLGQIDRQRRLLDQFASARQLDTLYQQAYDLLGSPTIRAGFDVEQEPKELRERYGQNAFGQSCLLARRLVERGARFVQVNFSRYVTQKGYGWDTHGNGAQTLKNDLVPKLNSGLGSLLDDLFDRGLLGETLVVAMGEFRRTPNVKKDGGRDHWPNCYSILLAGGGIHGGLVYVKSDRRGATPASDPVEPRQILLTILTLLGIPTFGTDNLGRQAPLFEGVEPVERLYS